MTFIRAFMILFVLPIVVGTSSIILADDRPNIVVIMSDDMGYSDIQPYGGEIETPHLERLADNGLRFSQFYNTGRCCPTRASLLTGLYQHQTGIGRMMGDDKLPGYRGDLNKNCLTIAEVLKSAGYATFISGKWHVTPYRGKNTVKHNWPLQRGFDRFFGTIHGAGSFFDPNSLARDNEFIAPESPDFYYTDEINDNAVMFINEHLDASPDQPFFLYVAHTAAHWPMHAKEKDIAKYKGKYDAGYSAFREQRMKRLLELGLINPQWKLTEQRSDWEKVTNKQWELRCMEVYAAMIDCMDQGIGRIIESLENRGELDNTLILFLQDNGGCHEGMGRNNKKETRVGNPDLIIPMKDGELQTQMIPQRTRDGRPVRQGLNVMPGPADTYHGYGIAWANVSNTPFREYKHWVHEGGISTPLIAHWPKGIKRKGEIEHQPGHLIDIMATCVDLAGAIYPDENNGEKIHPLEGITLKPTFSGENLNRTEPLFFEHYRNRAIRDGKWKLVAKRDGPWELYDMEVDRTETNNLAATHPDTALDLAEKWEAWAKRANVLPWPDKKPYERKFK